MNSSQQPSRAQSSNFEGEIKATSGTTKFLRSFDIFSFLPVPKTDPVSSRKSIIGSIIMLSLFLAYILYTFIDFVTNNAPRVNQYTDQLPFKNITLPKIAFGFFYGDPFSKTINDPDTISFSMQQIYKSSVVGIPDNKTEVQLVKCRPEWIPQSSFDFLCPGNQTLMIGALYQTKVFGYPRIVVNLCMNSSQSNCATRDEIATTAAGGRILLFVEDNGPNIDLTTGKERPAQPYRVFQFYIIPGLYPRAQVEFVKSTYNIQPDYLRRWGKQKSEYLKYDGIDVFQTNVSVFNSGLALQIYFQVNQEAVLVDLVYWTILDQVSKWGAFWGVLFAFFAMYFLKYNTDRFYDHNQEWENFDQRIGVHRITEDLGYNKTESKNIELSTDAKITPKSIDTLQHKDEL